jgi:hypothetical protein
VRQRLQSSLISYKSFLKVDLDLFNNAESGKNLVRLSRQFTAGANRRFKFEKRRRLFIRVPRRNAFRRCDLRQQPTAAHFTLTKTARVKDRRGVDLISDALPFGRLWYSEPDEISNAVGYAKFFSRSRLPRTRILPLNTSEPEITPDHAI